MKRIGSRWKVATLALLCCLLWGSAIPAIKASYALMGIETPFAMIQLAGIRFFMAGLLVLLFARILVRIPVWPRKIEWGVIAVVALIQTLGGYACSYIGMAHTQAAKASILSSLDVFFTMLLSHVVFRDDKLTIQKDLGLLLGMAGIVVINLSRGSISGSFSFTGEGLLVMASLLMSAAFIIIKKQSKTINLMRVNGWQHAIGGLLLGTLGYGGETQMIRFTGCSAGLLLYLVAVSAVTFSVWFLLLKHNKASEVTVYKFALPVFGVLFSVILLPSEHLTWLTAAGLLAISSGIIVSSQAVRIRINNG